jgi:hypothetical protein
LVNFGIRRVAEMQAKKSSARNCRRDGAASVSQRAASSQTRAFYLGTCQAARRVVGTRAPGGYRGLNARQMLRLIETNLSARRK